MMVHLEMKGLLHDRLVAYSAYLTLKTGRRWTLEDTFEKMLDKAEDEMMEIPVPVEASTEE